MTDYQAGRIIDLLIEIRNQQAEHFQWCRTSAAEQVREQRERYQRSLSMMEQVHPAASEEDLVSLCAQRDQIEGQIEAVENAGPEYAAVVPALRIMLTQFDARISQIQKELESRQRDTEGSALPAGGNE